MKENVNTHLNMDKIMKFYRYEERRYSDIDDFGIGGSSSYIRVNLITLNLHKETPKGYWIGYGSYAPSMLHGNSRWVAKSGKKRYAYPTKKEALMSFFKRKKQQVRILKNQLRTAETALRDAEGMLKTIKEFSE